MAGPRLHPNFPSVAQHPFHSTPLPGRRDGSGARTYGHTCDVTTSSSFRLPLTFWAGRDSAIHFKPFYQPPNFFLGIEPGCRVSTLQLE